MKSRNFKFALMAGFVGLASFVVTSCTDNETVKETQKVEDGISFAVSDIQNINEPSLPKTKAPSVYETTFTPLEGDAQGLELVETTVEGVNPVYIPAATRALVTDMSNFATINKNFAIFATKEGSTAANYLYNEQVKVDGTMVNPVKWKKSESSKLKFFAVHPAKDGSNPLVTTTSGTNPVVNYSPEANAKKHIDVLVANTEAFNYDDYISQKIPIRFSHATTAVYFKVGSDLSYNQKVKKIEIRNVLGSGTYDIATKTWTPSTTKKNFALEFDSGDEFPTNISNKVMNDGDGVFFMVPQDIPADADVKITFLSGKSVVAKIGGNGKKWVAGTTRTYSISNSKDELDREFHITAKAAKTTFNYDETNAPFTVTSYSKSLKPGSIEKPEPWTITKYEFSADGTTWTEGKPSMVAAMSSESGNGGTSAEARVMTLANDFHDYKAEREAALKAAPEATGTVDLSKVNGPQETANCYIVSASGKYSFPMVYGNAKKNGVDNTEAFNPSGINGSAVAINPFWGATKITGSKITGATKAEVLWSSTPGIVSDVAINGDNVEFKVNKANMKEASVIIGIKNSDPDGSYGVGNVLWSWHIWITSKDVVDTDNGYFMREPLGFRHTKWQGTSYQQDRKVRLTFTQTRTGKTAQVEFTQKAASMEREGEAMYYQQGRKDPLYPTSPMALQSPGTNPDALRRGFTLINSVKYASVMARPRKLWSDPTTKGNWDWMAISTADIGNGEPYYSESVVANTTYFNLWDANNGQGHGYTGTFVKTVYDPSPVGFRVPRLAEFEKINNGNNGKAAFTPLTGVLSHDDFTVKNKGTNGYYWSSEKKIGPGNFGGDEVYTGYYGLFALARGSQKDLVLKKDVHSVHDFPMFQNMAWGASVISIKE
ncbi:fimbrillin family protein [Prevotella melaninogenica]|uniref:Fibrobacter succinogene major domain protein n=1 Tax=Prevotella melaninogenica TaxID=28132 RepID=A0A250KIG5_9BACT|nr:fimbrillin family protein [Prevotella melaninogenica]BBA29704.1 fibrobacter succinogene major domain protein [Prevotella melaninogenica]